MDAGEHIDIFLMEDNPEGDLTAACAGGYQPHLLHLKDGMEALKYIFSMRLFENKYVQNTLRLILLDLKLPNLDGFDFLRKIRQDDRTKTLPVVILSSPRDNDDQATYQLGGNSYVVRTSGSDNQVRALSALAYFRSVKDETRRE